ncbi:helix-turn-helix domain-containing protein [Peribacillus simplex]|uniref:helix-turn-helix domain-containing protein n=1 Tax=Peribacillus simplex TaxID=1478 RepID=UPI0011504D57
MLVLVAEELKISLSTLYRKLKRYNLKVLSTLPKIANFICNLFSSPWWIFRIFGNIYSEFGKRKTVRIGRLPLYSSRIWEFIN